MRSKLTKIVCALWLSSLSSSLTAEVYQWVDKEGEVHFSDFKPETLAPDQVETKDYDSAQNLQSLPFSYRNYVVQQDQKVHHFQAEHAPKIEIFTARWCGACTYAKQYMAKNNIDFIERDIESNPSNGQRFKALGGQGVPLLLVGKYKMLGFDPTRLRTLIEATR